MDAVAAATPSLDASAVLAQGRRHRVRRRALLAAGATAMVILGFGAALSNPPLASRPPHPAAGPTAAATPSGPAASSAASPSPALDPAERFTKRPEEPYSGAYQSDIIDKLVPSDYSGETYLRLIRDPSMTALRDHVDDVAPEHLLVNGVEVRVYRTDDGKGVQQAEWIHNRTFYALLWQPKPGPYQISESDIQWLIAAAIDGTL
ncbi:MAG TPA: hypothetical protein VFX61_22655 [Micromonosporaceae bacterium]|nr:hypothetical protein [Micromonosporaceae bacterium]